MTEFGLWKLLNGETRRDLHAEHKEANENVDEDTLKTIVKPRRTQTHIFKHVDQENHHNTPAYPPLLSGDLPSSLLGRWRRRHCDAVRRCRIFSPLTGLRLLQSTLQIYARKAYNE